MVSAICVSAVILAYGAEPWLEQCVTAVLDSQGVESEVILVDNGCTDGSVERLPPRDRLRIVRPGRNLGFPGGCNLGAEHAGGQVLAFVNSDAVVAPDALNHLARSALQPDVGIATASVRLGDTPDRLNSGGNEIHFLGLSWSGAFGEAASEHTAERSVIGASGAAMALARDDWNRLGGFESHYFLYHEDAELSLRCWQLGLRVVYVPDAVVHHHYEFSRNQRKFYLIERNRLLLVLTLYEARTLVVLAPPLVALELAMVTSAVGHGWIRDKLAGWLWLGRNRGWVQERRRLLQARRVLHDGDLAPLFAARIRPGNFDVPSWLQPLDRLLSLYWRVVSKLLRRTRTADPASRPKTSTAATNSPEPAHVTADDQPCSAP